MIEKLADYGLSLNSSTGEITGVPTKAGTPTFKINAAGMGGHRTLLVNADVGAERGPWLDAPEGTGVYVARREYCYTDAAGFFTSTSNNYFRESLTDFPWTDDQEFTYGLLIKTDDMAISSAFFEHGHSNSGSAYECVYMLGFGGTNYIRLRVQGNNYTACVGMVSGKWYFVMVRRWSGGVMKITSRALDGSLTQETTYSKTVAARTVKNVYIGRTNAYYAGSGRHVKGVFILNRPMTDDEVDTAFNSGDGYTDAELPSDTLHHWPVGERIGAAQDVRGDIDLAAYNSPGTVSGPVEHMCYDRMPCSRFKDRMGVYADAVQATIAKQPTLGHDGTNYYLEFDRTNPQFLDTGPLPGLWSHLNPHEIMVVLQRSDAASSAYFGGHDHTLSDFYLFCTTAYMGAKWKTAATSTTTFAAGDTTLLGVGLNGLLSEFRRDGVALDTEPCQTLTPANPRFIIGSKSTNVAAGVGLTGRIYYVQVRQDALNPTSYRTDAEAWLKNNYGIS